MCLNRVFLTCCSKSHPSGHPLGPYSRPARWVPLRACGARVRRGARSGHGTLNSVRALNRPALARALVAGARVSRRAACPGRCGAVQPKQQLTQRSDLSARHAMQTQFGASPILRGASATRPAAVYSTQLRKLNFSKFNLFAHSTILLSDAMCIYIKIKYYSRQLRKLY